MTAGPPLRPDLADESAPPNGVADDVALIFGRRRTLDPHDRLQQHRPRFRDGILERQAARDLEGQIVGVLRYGRSRRQCRTDRSTTGYPPKAAASARHPAMPFRTAPMNCRGMLTADRLVD